MANINKIRVSGTTYNIQDINAPKVIELTQSEYDALTVKDPNAFYVITDSEYNFDGYWTSAQTQNAIAQSVSSKADTSAVTSVNDSLTAHTANTTVHVTAQDKTNWNAKSDFSGNYNDLTNKPTIPTVPTNVSDFTNDAGYITSDDITGKTNQSDFTAHTANTTVHVTANEKSTWNSKSDFSGNYNDLSNKPTIPSKTSDLTNDSDFATTGDVQTATNDMATKTWVGQQGYLTEHQDISGKQDVSGMTAYTKTSAFTAHTANTTVHVTASEKSTWNNKSDFSGDYNDLDNKPTIPTVPTSNTAFTNDAGYITSSALDGYATTGDVQTATNDMATKTWVGNQGYLTEHQSLSNYYKKSETSGATQISTALASKQDTLVSGTNIKTINGETLLGEGNITIEGGSDINVVQTTGTSTADVMSQDAVTTALNNKANKTAAVGGYKFGSRGGNVYLQYTNVNNSNIGSSLYYPKINGKEILTTNSIYATNNYNFQLVETSAITTSISSSSTDAQVPSAKAVNDQLGGLKLVKLTQSEYDALATKDSNTLYVING